jgi:hypothetical protein
MRQNELKLVDEQGARMKSSFSKVESTICGRARVSEILNRRGLNSITHRSQDGELNQTCVKPMCKWAILVEMK